MADDALLALALALPGAWPDEPWEGDTVAKVGIRPGKIFLFHGDDRVALKLSPADAAELRASYPGSVGDAPYLSKKHWVQIRLDGAVPLDELRQLVEESYRLVVAGLPRAQRP